MKTTKTTTAPREIAPEEKAPPGWPRPFYRAPKKEGVQQHFFESNEHLMPVGPLHYASWASATAEGQITECSASRTFMAGRYHLCTSCGQGMKRGLILATDACQALYREGGRSRTFDAYDTHYGGALCFRCALLASKHCPWFKRLATDLGEALPFVVTLSGRDFQELDETSALALTEEARQARPVITLGEVKEEVQAGRLHLYAAGAQDLPEERRPKAAEARERGFPEWDEVYCGEEEVPLTNALVERKTGKGYKLGPRQLKALMEKLAAEGQERVEA